MTIAFSRRTLSRASLMVAAAVLGASAPAATLTWNAGLPGDWNTSNTNWTGLTWNNATPDDAVFDNVSGTIALTEAITAGNVSFRWNGNDGNTRSPVLTGGTLTVTGNISVDGYGLGGAGVDSVAQAYNARAQISNTTNVTGNITVRRGMLFVGGGTLNVGGTINSSDAWNVFRSDNSTVTATGGVDLSAIASLVDLRGGTLTTPFIRVSNHVPASASTGLTMGDGVRIIATGNNADFIQVFNDSPAGSRAAATLTAGGVNLDTSTFAVTISTVLNGAGGLTKSGNGTLTLSALNAYAGGTTVSAGVLNIDVQGDQAASALGMNKPVTVAAGATLRLAQTDGLGYFGANPSSLVIGGTLTIASGKHASVGSYGLTLDGGTVTAEGAGSGEGNYIFDGAVTTLGNASTSVISAGQIKLRNGSGAANQAVTFDVADGAAPTDLSVSSVLVNGNGANGLIKSGNGTLVLSGNNSFGGGLTINGGTLRATRNTLGTGAVVVNNGGTLYANDQWVFCGGNGFGVAERNVASLTLNAGGTLSLDPNNGFANGITNFYLNGGTVTGGANSASFGALFLFNGNEQITAGGGVTSTIGVSVGINGNNNSITVDTGSRLELTNTVKNGEWSWAGRGSFVKNGAGTLVLSGANTFDGQVDIVGGTLLAANNTALGAGGHAGETMSFIRDGATLALRGGISLDEHFHVWGAGVDGLGAVRSLSGDNTLSNAPGGGAGFALRSNTTVGVDAGTLTVSGFYQDGGSFGLTKVGNGTLVLNVLNSYTGGTTVSGGILSLLGNGGNGRIRGALTVNTGGTVVTTGDGSGFGYNNQLSSLVINGGLVKAENSDLHLWNITGGVSMTGGELQTNGGTSTTSGSTFQWNRTSLSTNASANSAVISGRINLRADGGYTSWDVNVADGAADSDLLVSAGITGGGVTLTKTGNGKMTLTGGISYTGGTVVNAGTLEFPNGDWVTGSPWNDPGATGAITIGAGATLSTSAGVTQFRNGLTMNGGTLSSRGLIYGDWRNVVISSDVTAGGAAVSTISSVINLDGSRTWTVGAGSTLNVTGQIGSQNLASGSLTKSGNGTLSLSGDNSYAGATTINGGTLKIGNGGASGSLYSPSAPSGNLTFGSGAAIVNNGALVYDIAGGAVHVNRTISGLGTVSVTGDQSVHFADGTTISTTGTQSYSATATGGRYRGFNLADNATVTLTSSGAISLTGMLGTANGNTGRLIVNTSAGNGDVTLNTPVGVSGVDYGLAEIAVNAGSGAITLGTHNGLNWSTLVALSLTGGAVNATANIADLGALTVTNSAAGTFSGTLSGAASLTKAGNGTLTLSGANTYAGTTTINGGTLVLDAGGTYAYVGGSIAIDGGSTLRVSGQAYTFNGKTIAFGAAGGGTLDAIATGAGGMYQLGDNTISTSGGAQNTLSGTRIGTQNQGINLNYQTLTFDVAAGADPAVPNLNVTGTLWNGGNLTKSGNGILLLSGTNQYSGATTVNAGTLALGGSGSLNESSSVTINGATASLAHRSSVAVSSAVNLVQGAVSGTGTINSLTVSDGASNKIAPGNAGVGTLTVGTLSFLGLAGIDFNSAGTNATNRLSVGTLDLTNAGIVRLNVNGVAQGGWSTGTYDLIDYTSVAGSVGAIFQKGDITGTTTRTIADLKTDVAGKVSLVINSEIPKWTGLDGSEWKIGATGAAKNWKLSTNAATDYIQGDAVLFDDSATNRVVQLGAGVAPTAVTFNNTLPYSLEPLSQSDIGYISGTTGLTKNGSGELTILLLNDYSGATVINAGKITLSAEASLGLAAPLVLAGGQLDPGLTPQTFGAVTITQAAASGDTIELGSLVAPSYTISNSAGDAVISADLGGSNATFTKTGAGQVTLWGSNTYTGGTAINGGVLRVNQVLSAASAPLSLGGGQLDLGGTTQTVGAVTLTAAAGSGETIRNGSLIASSYAASHQSGDAILSANLRGGAAFTKTGSGALTLSGAGSVGGGAFTLTKTGAGTLNLMAGSALTGVTTVSGGTLVYGGAYASSTHAIASGAVLEIAVASGERDSAATTFSGAGTLRKTGNGRLIWGPGVATFALGSGSLIDVRGGEFTGGSYGNENWSSNLSSLNVEAGAIFNTVEANVRVNRITGTGTIQTGYGGAGYANLTIGVDNGSSTFDGVIANADAPGNLVKVGTGAITLAGANTYTGTTTVSEGTLRAGANAAFTNKGRLVLAGSAVLDLGGFNAAFTSFDSTSANLITNSSAGTAASNATAVGTPSGAGVYVDAFTLSALDQAINAQITDGTTRKTQLIIANNNSAANLANILNGANSFSGGLVMTSTGGGTRLRINSPLSGTPLGSGPIIIGQAATDKAQILFDSATPVTLANDIVVNTALGSDNSGALRVDTTGHVLSGKVTANLAALHLANTGSLRLTGQITGANGLILERGVTVTLANTTGSANNYAGDTVINLGAANGRSATLRLGAADQIPTGANAGNMTVSSSGTGIGLLDLNGFDQRINGLSGTGLVDGNAAGGAGTNTLTVGDNNASSSFSGILRNTVGTLALTKTGNGLLSLEGDNTYDGATSVQAGILQVGLGGLSGRLGRGAVTIASGATLRIDRSDAYGTTGGQTFSGAGTLVKEGSGDLTFWGTGAAQALVSGLQNLTVNGGVVRTDNWAQWKSDLNLTVSGAGAFELWNTTTSLGSLNGNGTVRNTANWSGYANGAAYATNNLTIASGNFSGTITDNGVGDGGNTGTSGDTRINLIKSGPGTLTLSAANTFGGTTSVNGGRLVVTHASALGAGAVTINAGTLQVDAAAPIANAITVNNGGLLGGKGSTGSVAVATGGALSPGASPGILNTGNLTLARGSIIHWQVLDGLGNAGVGYDQLMVNGMLDLTDASSTNRIILKISSINGQDQLANPLNFGAPNGVPSIRTFQFGQAGGLQLNNGVNISDLFSFDVTDFRYSDGSLSNAALWSIDWDGAGAITLTAVPEPSTYGLGLGALALAAAALRRRRRPAPQA